MPGALAAALVGTMVLAVGVGSVAIAPRQVPAILLGALGIEGGTAYAPQQELVLLHIRLPRVLLGALVGAALGVSGAVMQGLFRNPLAEPGLAVMVFVGSRGCVQIHTGPVERLVETGPWYNVLDPGFNLHLNETAVAETFVVTKPTADGPVTSLEVLDAEGRLIVQFFGKRKPGLPELTDWRALPTSL